MSAFVRAEGSRHPFIKSGPVAFRALATEEGGTGALEPWAEPKGAGGEVFNERGAAPVRSSITASTCIANSVMDVEQMQHGDTCTG